MPKYSFRCRKCGREFSVDHSMEEPHPESCILTPQDPLLMGAILSSGPAKCGGEIERIFEPQNVVYRTGGFYTTDSRLDPKEDD